MVFRHRRLLFLRRLHPRDLHRVLLRQPHRQAVRLDVQRLPQVRRQPQEVEHLTDPRVVDALCPCRLRHRPVGPGVDRLLPEPRLSEKVLEPALLRQLRLAT
jgi:hypothetical protein